MPTTVSQQAEGNVPMTLQESSADPVMPGGAQMPQTVSSSNRDIEAQLTRLKANVEMYKSADDRVKRQVSGILRRSHELGKSPAVYLSSFRKKYFKNVVGKILLPAVVLNADRCLHNAVSYGCLPNVEWMLKNGADTTLRDDCGRTAWELALELLQNSSKVKEDDLMNPAKTRWRSQEEEERERRDEWKKRRHERHVRRFKRNKRDEERRNKATNKEVPRDRSHDLEDAQEDAEEAVRDAIEETRDTNAARKQVLVVQRREGAWSDANKKLALHVAERFLDLECRSKERTTDVLLNGCSMKTSDMWSIHWDGDDWFSMEQQTQVDALYAIRSIVKSRTAKLEESLSGQERATGTHVLQAHGVNKHILQNFAVTKLPGSRLLFRQPCFATADVDLWPEIGEVCGVWSFSMPYFRGLSKTKVLIRNPGQSRKYCCGSEQDRHVGLTLDEFHKPVLDDITLSARINDQVLVKFQEAKDKQAEQKEANDNRVKDKQSNNTQAKENRARDDQNKASDITGNIKLVTIHQAWIWMMQDLVVTGVDEHMRSWPQLPDDDQHEYRKFTRKKRGRRLCMRTGQFLSDLIDLLNQSEKAGFSENIFDSFEQYIVIISEDVSKYLKVHFEGSASTAGPLDVEDFDVKVEAGYFHNIIDIREELSMIQAILDQQEELWQRAMQVLFPEYWIDGVFVDPMARNAGTSNTRGNATSGRTAAENPDPLTMGTIKQRTRSRDSRPNPPAARRKSEQEREEPVANVQRSKSEGDRPDSSSRVETQTRATDKGQTRASPATGRTEEERIAALELIEKCTSKEYRESWSKIARPQTQFKIYKQRIRRLEEDAMRVQESISILVELRSKHASMAEAHSTAVMSAAVFGFTIVTVIFTPLSFMASLFALPIDRFQQHQVNSTSNSTWEDSEQVYTTKYIGTWFAVAEVVSVFLTAALMYVAVDLLRHGPLSRKWWDSKPGKKWKKWRETRKQKKADRRAEEEERTKEAGKEKEGEPLDETPTATDSQKEVRKPGNRFLNLRKRATRDLESQAHAAE